MFNIRTLLNNCLNMKKILLVLLLPLFIFATEFSYDEAVRSSVIPLADKYLLEASASRTNTGNLFTDYINADSDVCGNYVNAIRE